MDEPIRLWRSLEEIDGDRRAKAAFSPSRRDFLKLAGAATALATASCRAPVEEIVPYVQPAPQPPGTPRFFATAMALGGSATGLLVETHQGRPTKVEGNPAHPSSLGATDVFAQAAILQLWDPERSRTVRHAGAIATRGELEAEWRDVAARIATRHGEGLRILTAPTSSATLSQQIGALNAAFPAARWHVWDPLHRDRGHAGARLAFGRVLEPIYRFDQADVVVAVDADFVGVGPGHLRYARDFIARRRPTAQAPMSRLYVVESSPTLAGAMADHRVALAPAALERWLGELASALDGAKSSPLATAAARELLAHRGRALIVPGETLRPEAHAFVHALNARLGAPGRTVDYIEPVAGDVDCAQSIRALADDVHAGRVEALFMLGGNPVYDAPADAGFAEALAHVPFSLHLGLYEDESAARCRWHVPEAHFLEHWSDARAHDGTATIVQPLIAPLHGGVSAHEIVAMIAGDADANPYARVQAQWKRGASGDFAAFWETALRDGLVANTAFTPVAAQARAAALPAISAARGWSVCLRGDYSVRDGAFANNAWLQELPRPQTKLTWDNAALVSPASARALGVANGDLVEVAAADAKLRAPVWILPGQADDAITLHLGYGRARAGSVGSGVGVNAYALRRGDTPWAVEAVQVRKVGGHHDFATTQNHWRMEGRDPVRRVTAADLVAGRVHADDKPPEESLYPPWPYDSYRWAMVVDLNACIGCNACTIACQAENNIPTVGKEQVARGREMHWIRVDTYYEGPAENPRFYFQPVPCMHCEDAPCEAVCPVGATVHDSEGINVQVYNRCVGTRFCSNNCPYKVRRFNFLHFAAGPGEPPLEGRNPEVTTRMRGVMEKCNYCLQRITRARLETDKAGRRIADGEVVTACQAACPTRAITFGDLSDPASAVSRAKRSPLDYVLLNELNTRPRTTYHARLLNPNPDVGEG